MILISRHVVAERNRREAANVEGVGVTLAVDERAAGLRPVAEGDAVGVADAVACARREARRALHFVAAAEGDARRGAREVRVTESEGVEPFGGRV